MCKFNYSIVIPCRNRLELLVKAVSSIPDRKDIQIIIVDNSETSMEPMFHSKHAESTVNYMTSSPHKGAGCARNVGLRYVEGRYVLFMDSDDYYTHNAFESFDRYLDSNADIIYFYSSSINLSTGTNGTRHYRYNKMIDLYLDKRIDNDLRYQFSVPWSKMYKADFIKKNNLSFEEVKASNDLMFSLKSGFLAKTIEACRDIVYVVTEGEVGTSLVKTRDANSLLCRYEVAIRKNLFLKEHNLYQERERLLGYIKTAFLEVGIKQALLYLKLANKNRLSIF